MGFALLLSCNAQCSQNTSKAEDLKTLAFQDSTLILDVRTVQEFSDGHFEGSVNIPLNILTDSVESLRKYKHIITICRSGNRSGQAKRQLNERGFDNVTNGGGWQAFKEKVEK